MKLFRVKQLEWRPQGGRTLMCLPNTPKVDRVFIFSFTAKLTEEEPHIARLEIEDRFGRWIKSFSAASEEEAVTKAKDYAQDCIERIVVKDLGLEEVGIQLNQDYVEVKGAFDIASRRYLIQVRTEMMMGQGAVSEEELHIRSARDGSVAYLVEMTIQNIFEALSHTVSNNMVKVVPIDQVNTFHNSGHRVSDFFKQKEKTDENERPLLLDDRRGVPTDPIHDWDGDEVDEQGSPETPEA